MTTEDFFRDVERAGGIDALEELRLSRLMHRAVYSTDAGVRELASLAVRAGLFTKLDPSDPMAIGRHNMMVDIFDDMGLLDERNMESVVAYMLTLPAMPDAVAKE